jgi:double-stranded uracil-DNA glycosylase
MVVVPAVKMTQPVLPDLLQPGLRLVICGTAAGTASAKLKAYYAGRGNRFWEVLHQIGFTPTLLRPEEYLALLNYGIGLTDLAKREFGSDASLPNGCFDVVQLRTKIEVAQPRILAFNGKRAASEFFGATSRALQYGCHSDRIGETLIYVLPSTSGAASAFWSLQQWQEMAKGL